MRTFTFMKMISKDLCPLKLGPSCSCSSCFIAKFFYFWVMQILLRFFFLLLLWFNEA
jgi:hypothetical protein